MKQFILDKGKNGKLVFWYTMAYFVGTSLLVLAQTNLFTESMFQPKYLIMNSTILFNTVMVSALQFVYWRDKSRI